MPNIPKIALSFLLAIIAFVVGKILVDNLGTSSRWLIILAVIIFYVIWWKFRRHNE